MSDPKPSDIFFRGLHLVLHDEAHKPDPNGVHGSLWGEIHTLLHGLGYYEDHEDEPQPCPKCAGVSTVTEYDSAGRPEWTCMACGHHWYAEPPAPRRKAMAVEVAAPPGLRCPKCNGEKVVMKVRPGGTPWLVCEDPLCQHEWILESKTDDAEDSGERLVDEELRSQAVGLRVAKKRAHELLKRIAAEDHSLSWPAAWLLRRFWPRLAYAISGWDDPGPEAKACIECDGEGVVAVYGMDGQASGVEKCERCGGKLLEPVRE